MLFLLSLPLLSLLYDLPSSTPVYFLGQSYFCFAKILLWMPAFLHSTIKFSCLLFSVQRIFFLDSFPHHFCCTFPVIWQFFTFYSAPPWTLCNIFPSTSTIAAFTLLLFLTLKVMLQINFQCALATFSPLISNYKLTIPSDALFDSTNLFTCSSFKMTPTLFLFLSTPWRKAKERS